MKTAIYIRVSTEEQVKEGYSISAQKQKLKAFCISQGWDAAGIYVDEGISAKDTNRPELQRMVKDIKEGKIECVLVYRLDRLTRSVFDLYKLLEVFEEHDCKFKSATEVYDTTTAMGRMFITIVAALAQWERENMGERIAFGYAEKARQGKWPLNFPPFGYDLNTDESILYINQREAKTVNMIYDLYSKNGMSAIASTLNKESLYTKQGNEWSEQTIRKVLKGHVYYGYIDWKGMTYKGLHEGIIEKSKWDEIQNLIKIRTGQPGRSVSSNYIFSGKLLCPNCGRNLTGNYTNSVYKGKTSNYKYYRCKHKLNGRCKKGAKLVSEIKLDKAFLDYLENINFDDMVNEVANEVETELNKKDESVDVEYLQAELEKLDRQKRKWQYAWSEDVISFEDFKKRMDEAQVEISKIEKELGSVEKEETEPLNLNEIVAALKDIKSNWITLDDKDKKNLVSTIVERIHYSHEGNKIIINDIDFVKLP